MSSSRLPGSPNPAPKRKRSSSPPSPVSRLPSDSINPRSYPPNVLKQLSRAGLDASDALPSEWIPQFPHRSLPRDPFFATSGSRAGPRSASRPRSRSRSRSQSRPRSKSVGRRWRQSSAELESDRYFYTKHGDSSEPETKDETGAESSGREGNPWKSKVLRNDHHTHTLAAIIHRSLNDGNVARAKRAFAALLRSDANGYPVDLRQNSYWALGAEILMREGETPRPPSQHRSGAPADSADSTKNERGAGPPSPREPAVRWGSAANAPRVRAYYEALIQQFPFNRHHPRAVSALTFWPVLAGLELYNAHAEQRAALRRAAQEHDPEAAAAAADDDDDDDNEWPAYEPAEDAMDVSGEGVGVGGREAEAAVAAAGRLRATKERVRRTALATVRDVARRMDAAMEDLPYSASHEMLRLRGMAALYMGDLAMAARPRTAREEAEGRARRAEERVRARARFERILRDGGHLDDGVLRFVRQEEKEEEEGLTGSEGAEDSSGGEGEGYHMFSGLAIRPAPS